MYEDIIKCHLSYVKSNYGTTTIFFDRYGQISTKDHKYARQMAEQPPGADAFVTEKGSIHPSREEFLGKKNGLSRVSACEECRGVGCFNIIDIMGKEEEDHDEKERNLFYDLFL